MKPDTIMIDNVKYVREDSINVVAEKLNGMKYVIVRSRDAGVFAGYLAEVERESAYAKLKHARRIWYWSGAASLSKLAEDGTSDPNNCKFPKEVTEVELFGICEIITVSKKAQKIIIEVPEWKK